MRMVEFARANRLPYNWQDAAPPQGGGLPLVRLPGGGELHGPTTGQVLRALGISFPVGVFTAAFFALHPVNVATVAWMAERKDLPRSANIGDAMLLLSSFELPPLGAPVSSENRHECRARTKRERQRAKKVVPGLTGARQGKGRLLGGYIEHNILPNLSRIIHRYDKLLNYFNSTGVKTKVARLRQGK